MQRVPPLHQFILYQQCFLLHLRHQSWQWVPRMSSRKSPYFKVFPEGTLDWINIDFVFQIKTTTKQANIIFSNNNKHSKEIVQIRLIKMKSLMIMDWWSYDSVGRNNNRQPKPTLKKDLNSTQQELALKQPTKWQRILESLTVEVYCSRFILWCDYGINEPFNSLQIWNRHQCSIWQSVESQQWIVQDSSHPTAAPPPPGAVNWKRSSFEFHQT